MMGGLAALERSEKQWRELVKGTGLKVVKFWFPEGSIDGVVELMLEDGVERVNGTNGHFGGGRGTGLGGLVEDSWLDRHLDVE